MVDGSRAALERVGPTLPGVARRALYEWATTGRQPQLADESAPRAGVFVTLRRADGSLRGCIGSVQPVTGNVVAETARSAVLAAGSDPRFPPVAAAELEALSVEVSVLEEPEPIATPAELDPAHYGVIVSAGGRRGLLLPGIAGIDTVAAQLAVARRKAGIAADEPVQLRRFRVRSFH